MRVERTHWAISRMAKDEARSALSDMTPEEQRAFDDAMVAGILEWSDHEEKSVKTVFARAIKRSAGHFRR